MNDAAFPVIYEDRDLLVCVKAPGVPCQPDPTGDPDLLSQVQAYLDLSGGNRRDKAGLIHRLDRGTGGLMVFGKNDRATGQLSQSWQDKGEDGTHKEYLALVTGQPSPSAGRMDDWLFTDRSAGKAYVTDHGRKGAKDASLLYTVLSHDAENDRSLVLVHLLTGRTHQIRAQFASRRHPLCGDGKYGSRVKGEIALWALRVSFRHPVTGRRLCFTALPENHPGFPPDTEQILASASLPDNFFFTDPLFSPSAVSDTGAHS